MEFDNYYNVFGVTVINRFDDEGVAARVNGAVISLLKVCNSPIFLDHIWKHTSEICNTNTALFLKQECIAAVRVSFQRTIYISAYNSP